MAIEEPNRLRERAARFFQLSALTGVVPVLHPQGGVLPIVTAREPQRLQRPTAIPAGQQPACASEWGSDGQFGGGSTVAHEGLPPA